MAHHIFPLGCPDVPSGSCDHDVCHLHFHCIYQHQSVALMVEAELLFPVELVQHFRGAKWEDDFDHLGSYSDLREKGV